MLVSPRLRGRTWSLALLPLVLLLGGGCGKRVEHHREPIVPSMGLPPLSAGADAAVAPGPDAGPGPDGPRGLLAIDAAAPDVAQPPPDGPGIPDLPGPSSDVPTAALDAPGDVAPVMLTDAELCSSTSATAKPIPVDIFVLLDRSGSMTSAVTGLRTDAGLSVSRWDSMKQALGNFVMSPAAAGIHIGLGYFPPTSYDECNVMLYATPAVPVDVLPGVAPAFMASLNMTSPGGLTPTLPAMEGAVQYAQRREMMLGRRTAIALATDGQPTSCNSSLTGVTELARMAAARGIFTFVIGVGGSLQSFNSLAAAGGTGTAYLVESATPNELATAFRSVQSQASMLACAFSVPPPPPGETVDTSKVTVRFVPTANPTAAFDIPMVAARADCGPTGGYFFDDLAAPTTVSLCEASCQKVNGTGEGALSLAFGCRAR